MRKALTHFEKQNLQAQHGKSSTKVDEATDTKEDEGGEDEASFRPFVGELLSV